MMTKRYHTITEAAQLLGVTRSAVFRAIKAGRLKALYGEVVQMRRSRLWRVDPASLQGYEVSLLHQGVGKKTV